MAEEQTTYGRFFLVLGFALRAFENLQELDVYLDITAKLTSIISFCIFLFLNYPRIKTRSIQVYREYFKSKDND